jgi:hypothetical protein
MIDKEVEVFFLGMDQYAKLTDLGKEFVNCVGSSNHMDLEANNRTSQTIDIDKTGFIFKKPEYLFDRS